MSPMNSRPVRQSGFGLVELMIGMLVGMIVVAAALSLLTKSMATSNDTIKMSRLDQELRQVMTMLTRDLRRATSWEPAVDVARVSLAHPLTFSGNSGNVTVTSSTGSAALDAIGAKAEGGILVHKQGNAVYKGTITTYDSTNKRYNVTLSGTWPTLVTDTDGVPASSWGILRPESTLVQSATCIVFAYDTDGSGTYANVERFGYRYDATNLAVEIRTSASATDNCTTGGSWENLTDENTVEVTAFSVTDNSPAALVASGVRVEVREYTIRVEGRLKADHSVVRTLQETVRVRNDRVDLTT